MRGSSALPFLPELLGGALGHQQAQRAAAHDRVLQKTRFCNDLRWPHGPSSAPEPAHDFYIFYFRS